MVRIDTTTLLLGALAIASTFGAGLDVDRDALGRIRAHALPILRVWAANVLLLPIAATVLLRLVALPSDVSLGLALAAAAPGGASGPLLAARAGGSPERIALTYVALAIASAAAPIVAALITGTRFAFSTLTLVKLVALQLSPLFLGLTLARARARTAKELAPRMRTLGTLLLVMVMAVLTVERGHLLRTLGPTTAACIGGLVAASLMLPYALGTGTNEERSSIAVLSTVRNLTLAFVVAEVAVPGGRTSMVVGAYCLVMYVVAVLGIRLGRVRTSA